MISWSSMLLIQYDKIMKTVKHNMRLQDMLSLPRKELNLYFICLRGCIYFIHKKKQLYCEILLQFKIRVLCFNMLIHVLIKI